MIQASFIAKVLTSTLLGLCVTLTAPPENRAAETGSPSMEPSPLELFFSALDARGLPASRAMVRISWWGDSAVAGDGYTSRIRTRLQERFGDGGAGIVLADPTFKGYRHGQVRLKRNNWTTESVLHRRLRHGRYGLTGSVMQSYGGASSTFIARGEGYDRVTVFFRGGPNRGLLQLYVDEEGLARADHLTRRDSAEESQWTFDLQAASKWIRVRAAGKGSVELYAVALERKLGGLVLDTMGHVGLRARGLLRINAAHFSEQVRLRAPHLVAIHFGGNERVDARLTKEKHQKEISALIQRLKKGHPQTSCLVVGPLPHGVRSAGKIVLDPRLEIISAGQRSAAAEEGCAYFDAIEHFGGKEGLQGMVQNRLLAKDLAHLTTRGHTKMGDLVADWLIKAYDASGTP